jgi:2-iminobutanoate/2-iminopropanoate deaminase
MRILFATLVCFTLTLSAAEKKAVSPAAFGKGGGPFSQGILADGTLYVAGQIGRDLKLGKIPEDFEAEVSTALTNIGLILKEAGMDFSNAVTVTVYMTDLDLFPKMNAVYVKFFPEPRPARATVGVAKLVAGAKIEISVTAKK